MGFMGFVGFVGFIGFRVFALASVPRLFWDLLPISSLKPLIPAHPSRGPQPVPPEPGGRQGLG